jgi:methylthioribose-1-phosphate isomerase
MRAIEWSNGRLKLLDQTLLPNKVEYIEATDHSIIMDSIKRLAVRGAPAIGIAAAFALAFAARKIRTDDPNIYANEIRQYADEIGSVRPTAVNLRWALDRLLRKAFAFTWSVGQIPDLLLSEAEAILAEDIEMCKGIGRNGASLLPDICTVLTHCNTGALATGDYGTAQSVIVTAAENGKKIRVYVDETRPLFQGARLTMTELLARGIDATLITDSTAAFVMQKGFVDAVITGADRIAANGDTANKVGTYGLAVHASYHRIPFYIAAPTSTIDPDCPDGKHIPIEERDPKEVTEPFGLRIAPVDTPVYSPAFDITPAHLITAIITERGISYPPFIKSLRIFGTEEGRGRSDDN